MKEGWKKRRQAERQRGREEGSGRKDRRKEGRTEGRKVPLECFERMKGHKKGFGERKVGR
jgi:hypothetical protein